MCSLQPIRFGSQAGTAKAGVLLWLLTAVGATTLGVLAADVSLQAYLDRTQVSVGEQFTLSIELSGGDAENASEPQPPDLGAFARYAGSGTSRSLQIVNGQMSSQRTINFYYQATSEGEFEIPSVRVSLEGETFETNPIRMTVGPSQGNPIPRGRSQNPRNPARSSELTSEDLFVKVEADKTRVYQNEAILVTYKIYTRVSVSSYEVTKTPDRTGFWVEDLLQPQRQPETFTEVINGSRYTVAVIQRLAIFPTSPGKKTLNPLELECEVRVRTAPRSVFDDFFNDPFGRTARFSISSKPVEIEVLPLPEEGKPRNFSGAVGQFQIEGEIDKSILQTNEVTTLRLTLEGTGNIRTAPRPQIEFPPGIEAYDPEITEEIGERGRSIGGRRSYEFVLVPRTAADHRIKPVEFAYFDPVEERYRVSSTREFVIQSKSGTAPSDVPRSGPARQDVRLLAQEIRFIKLDPEDLRPAASLFYQSALFWFVTLLPIVAVTVAWLVRRRSDRLSGDVAYARDRRAAGLARKHLIRARSLLQESDQKEFFAECAKALRGFAADKLNVPEPGLLTEDLESLLTESGVPQETVKDYLQCLKVSDMRHFAPVTSSVEEMNQHLTEAEEMVARLHKELSK